MAHQLPLLINGEFVASQTDQWIAVTNPATQETPVSYTHLTLPTICSV